VDFVDYQWVKRVAWETFDIDRAGPMVQLGSFFIGELVRHRRYRLKLSQAELGLAAGVSQPVISRLERGRLRGIRFARLAQIVAVLGGLDPNGPIPHWIIRRGGWHHGTEAVPADDPRWFSPSGLAIALEEGIVKLEELSGIGPTPVREPPSRSAVAPGYAAKSNTQGQVRRRGRKGE
jgi:transcriptional regulator with XRE-family HTH domain